MNRVKTVLGSILIAFLLVTFVGTEVMAYDAYHHEVRVRIGQGSSAAAVVSVGTYRVQNSNGSVVSVLYPGSSVTLTDGMSLSSVDGQGRFLLNEKEYRGDLFCEGGNLVNHLGMEEYLYSVVMMEMGLGAPGVEALKAQAVACRNFAFYRLENPRSNIYDLTNTASDQSYGGFSAERYDEVIGRRVREAVDGTRDQVMRYDGALIVANYMANAGGATENAENVWGGSRPYLQGVRCPWDAYPYIADTGSYTAVKMPSYEWSYTISCADLTAKIPSVGSVIDVTVDHGDCFSGYADKVTVIGTEGTKSYTGAQFRSLLGLRSSAFDIIVGKSVAANRALSAELITSEHFSSVFSVSGNMITIQGRGYGHSVGMSQWSACVMADKGYDYKYILNYFYNQNQNNGRLVISEY